MKTTSDSSFKTRSWFTAIFGLLVSALMCGIALDARSAGPVKVSGRLLVKPKAHVADGQLQTLFRSYAAQEQSAIPQINVRILAVPPAQSDAVLAALQRNPNIEFAEVDYLLEPDAVPNDTHYSSEWHLPKIGAPSAWDTTTGSSAVTIAILDSGIDGTHPDLAPRMVTGWNYVDNNGNTTDVTGHGTSVAGAAAATGNDNLGVSGVAWNCRIMPLRIADTNGYAIASAVASALTWAADHDARVANISYRGITKMASVNSAAQYFQSKKGVVIASAGNDSTFDATPDNTNFLMVSSTSVSDVLSTWSNTGNNIDLAAPGESILTTIRGGSYGWAGGTSLSAPIVAGVAALAVSANPNLTAPQLHDVIKLSADDLGAPGWDSSYGWGRVNAARAVLAAVQMQGGSTNATDTTAPATSISSPGTGSTVSDVVTINVLATDNVGIAKVECYMNGVLSGSNSSAPASFTWDTTGYPNGSYTLQARAYDASGNMGNSAFTTVTVQNVIVDEIAPTVQIVSPVNGAVAAGKTMSVSVAASDNVGVTRVELNVNGKLYQTSSSASPVFVWNTSKLRRGSYLLQATAYDAAGHSTRSAVVTVYK